jgi:hypothetical protein
MKRRKNIVGVPRVASQWIKLEHKIEVQLRKLANVLQDRFMRTKTMWKRVHFILFCLAFGVASTMCIIRAVSDGPAPFQIETISRPRSIFPLDDQYDVTQPLTIREDVFQRVMRFDSYLDSLKASKEGARIYDSIILTRPGLLDSLQLVKQIFKR